MSEAKTGEAFIKHEFDEAIAIQQTIVDAEQELSETHPEPAAKRSIKSSLGDDKRFLDKLKRLGREHGATGKAEEVAQGLKQLMEETAGKATDADSEAYEATAVLLNLKRKQQDSASAMVKLGRERKDSELRDAATEFHKATKVSAEDLAEQLAAYAVKIANQGKSGGASPAR